MNEQIEEMAKEVCGTNNECKDCQFDKICISQNWATIFYNAGCRKQSEGRWEYQWFDSYCSVCGWENKADLITRTRNDYPYCPNCGARMKGANDD